MQPLIFFNPNSVFSNIQYFENLYYTSCCYLSHLWLKFTRKNFPLLCRVVEIIEHHSFSLSSVTNLPIGTQLFIEFFSLTMWIQWTMSWMNDYGVLRYLDSLTLNIWQQAFLMKPSTFWKHHQARSVMIVINNCVLLLQNFLMHI